MCPLDPSLTLNRWQMRLHVSGNKEAKEAAKKHVETRRVTPWARIFENMKIMLVHVMKRYLDIQFTFFHEFHDVFMKFSCCFLPPSPVETHWQRQRDRQCPKIKPGLLQPRLLQWHSLTLNLQKVCEIHVFFTPQFFS